MNISAWSIKNPTPAALLFILLTVLGLFSFKRMIVQEYPDVELPMVVITTILPGASPTQLENEVARKIENGTANLPDIRHVYTVIDNSTVTTMVELRLEKNLSDAVDDLRDVLSRIRSDLPADIREQSTNRAG